MSYIFFAKVKNDVTRGHQRSNFTVIRLRPAFSDKWRRSSWTIRVRRARKKTLDSPFTDLSVACSQIWPQVNCLASRDHEMSKWPISEDFVFLSLLWTPKIYVNDFTTIVFSSSRRVKSQKGNLTSGQGHDLTQIDRLAYHSICIDERNAMVLFWSLYHASIKSY